jgi:hypothetical protein
MRFVAAKISYFDIKGEKFTDSQAILDHLSQ